MTPVVIQSSSNLFEIFFILAIIFGFGFLLGSLIIMRVIRKRLDDGDSVEDVINSVIYDNK